MNDALDGIQRERWVFTYHVEGDIRFLSHHDTMRMFERALVRASLPVRYTEGFNPHIRLSIPLPRPVGVASEAEAVVIEFACPIDGTEAKARLSQQMPEGIEVVGARRLGSKERMQPTKVCCRLDCENLPQIGLEAAVKSLRDSKEIPVDRHRHKDGTCRRMDMRPYIIDVTVEGDVVECEFGVTPQGTIRPAEFVELLGFEAAEAVHRMRRITIQWIDEQL